MILNIKQKTPLFAQGIEIQSSAHTKNAFEFAELPISQPIVNVPAPTDRSFFPALTMRIRESRSVFCFTQLEYFF